MKIELNKKQESLKQELREYFTSMMTSSLTKELSDDKYFEGGGPEFRNCLLYTSDAADE